MSIVLKILVPAVPPHNADAYTFANALAQSSADLPPATRLVQFHDALIARYPCWSSGAYSGAGTAAPAHAACPWTEMPLINCFRGDMGIIGIDTADPAVLSFVLRRAGAFALTVIDEAGGKVYRPATFSVALTGIQKHVNIPAMVTKLMPLLKASREEVLAAIATPHVLLKCRLDYVTAKRFAATMDLIGCDCTIEKEVLVPVGGNVATEGVTMADGRGATGSGASARSEAGNQHMPMSRFEFDQPAVKPRRAFSLAPSWLARIFGKANPSR